MKLKRKIMLTQLLIALFMIIVVVFVLPDVIYYTNWKTKLQDTMSLNQQMMSRLEIKFKDLERLSSIITKDTDLRALINRAKSDASASNIAYIKNYLSNIGRRNNMDSYQVLWVYIKLSNGMEFESVGLNKTVKAHLQGEGLAEFENNAESSIFLRPFYIKKVARTEYFTDTSEWAFGYIFPYKLDNNTKGSITIVSMYDGISSIFSDLVQNDKDFLLLTSNDAAVYPSRENSRINIQKAIEQTSSGPSYMEGYFFGKQGITTIKYSMYGGWKLIAKESKDSIINSNQPLIVVILGIITVFIMLFLATSFPAVNQFIKPLEALTFKMKEISRGNLKVKVKVTTNDEVGILGDTFNYMSKELEQYIRKLVQKEKDEQTMKYSLLVTQIDPHFIYNTMNTITYLASKGRSEDVVEVNKAMIEILRDRLRIEINDVFDNVEQEVNVVKKYIVIQSYRYERIFKTKWSIDENVLNEKIPKNIIQPLVENSLIHGIIQNKDENGEHLGGLIEIGIKKLDNRIIIFVSDNGTGIDREKLVEIEASKKPRGRNIGIRNIRERLSYIYQKDFSLEIYSELEMGTKITINLPLYLNRKSENDNNL